MSLLPPTLEKNFESISNIAKAASGIGIFFGGIIVLFYSIKIGHFPQDISLGDGLIFLLTATVFGLLYGLFVISLIALSITASPMIRPIFNGLAGLFKCSNENQTTQKIELVKFQGAAVLFAFVAIVYIAALGHNDPWNYLTLPLLSLTLYLLYSFYVHSGQQISKASENKSQHVSGSPEESEHLKTLAKHKHEQLIIFILILTAPLLVGGILGQFVDGSMRAIKVRIENPIVYVKEPYASLIPQTLVAKSLKAPKDYSVFEKTTVLWTGYGKTTVISYLIGTKLKQLDIPNDQIIIVKP